MNLMHQSEQTDSKQSIQKRPSRLYFFFKRAFDIISSFFALIILFPVMLIISLAVIIEDGGMPFYSHKRIGKDGKEFYIHKFRSMVKNSQDLEHLLTPEQFEQYYKEFKIDDDPRITKMGKFLRVTSLDELPQLWDIFVGKLSVIGPRPLVKQEIELYYADTKDFFLSCKPGLTGYWQAYARNNATYKSGERQQMELYYVNNRSLWLDIKILFKTVFSVISRKGAK